MVTLIRTNRKSTVLTSSSLSCLKDTPAINLTSGCAHGCLYCYARGYSNYPGDNRIVVYENILEKLKRELEYKRKKPTAIYFSPSSDMFQPVLEVLELSYSVLEYIFSKDIGVSFLTKGEISEKIMGLLANNADKVRAQIGIITHDDSIRRILEPNTASTKVRLQQMKTMVVNGITVEARIMPILPHITDTGDSLKRLIQIITSTGIERVAISTLFLRPAIAGVLRRLVPNIPSVKVLLDSYNESNRLPVNAGHSSVITLPRPYREDIYNRFKEVAKEYGLNVSVCGCMNPDIGGSCNIGGKWPEHSSYDVQLSLFSRKT